MHNLPPSSLGAAADIVRWILEGKTLDGRLRRIEAFLENEGVALPWLPKGVDRSEEGTTRLVHGLLRTVAYSVDDQRGRKVYHYREIEIDHIMLQRIRRGEEWSIEHLSMIPRILKQGRIQYESDWKVVYESREMFRYSDYGFNCTLWVIIRPENNGHWHVVTFFPRYPRR